jgi:hypothetical protein
VKETREAKKEWHKNIIDFWVLQRSLVKKLGLEQKTNAEKETELSKIQAYKDLQANVEKLKRVAETKAVELTELANKELNLNALSDQFAWAGGDYYKTAVDKKIKVSATLEGIDEIGRTEYPKDNPPLIVIGIESFESSERLFGTYSHERIHAWQKANEIKSKIDSNQDLCSYLREMHATYVNIQILGKLNTGKDFDEVIKSEKSYNLKEAIAAIKQVHGEIPQDKIDAKLKEQTFVPGEYWKGASTDPLPFGIK